MARTRKISGMHFTSLLLVLFLGLFAVPEAQGATCEEGTGVPPFLGTETVDPNVLLMLDNSASMLDLAIVGSAGICYDGTDDDTGIESYDGATDYSGYFRPYRPYPYKDLEDAWYEYDLSSGRFVKNAALGVGAVNNCSAVAGQELFSALNSVCVWAVMDNTDPLNPIMTEVTRFAARGNFLNWATASKLDIQKKVLTGGKYDSTNGDITLESRGCLNHRYVKKIGVQYTKIDSTIGTKYLTLGINRPAAWKNGTVYPANSVVLHTNTLTGITEGYYTAAGGTASGTSPADDTGVTWEMRDYTDLTQIEVFPATDTGVEIAACQEAIEMMAAENPILGQIKIQIDLCLEQSGAPTTLEADSNAIFNQTTQDCWFMNKHPENWDEMAEGDTIDTENMSNIIQGCENVYAGLAAEGLNPTDILPGDTGYACFGVQNPQQGYVGRCWDLGAGASCTDDPCGSEPATGAAEICVDRDPVDGTGEVYYCPGNYNAGKNECKLKGVVIPEADYIKKVNCTAGAAAGWDTATYSNVPPGGGNELHGCIQQALEDYCGYFSTPEVIDPSDQEGSVSGDYYNAPAILIEAATQAQLGKPLLTMNGRIASTDPAPTGFLSQYSKKLRFGAMAFNKEGQQTECDPTGDQNLLLDCEDKLDGAQVISYMDISNAHTTQLLGAINDIKGTAWTPLAEAMYTAIGYFSQDTTMRLNPSDFLVQAEVDAAATANPWSHVTVYAVGDQVTHGGLIYIANSAGTSCAVGACSGPESDDLLWTKLPALPSVADPVEAYCQFNEVIFITEGASTVDANPTVKTFVETNSADYSGADSDACGRFNGSTYLDDLTWYGWQGDMWSGDADKEKFQGIRSWIVQSAERETGLTGECDPETLLTAAALDGSLLDLGGGNTSSTPMFKAAGDEKQFREDLEAIAESISAQTSSGSAASIISASGEGEGALYQAIFWPDKESGITDADTGEEILVKWTGEVHSFLVDTRGFLYMDNCKDGTGSCQTGGLDAPVDADYDGALDTLTDRDTPVVVFYDQSDDADTSGSSAEGTKACPASLVSGEFTFFDVDGSCLRTPIALEHVDYLWSTSDWLNSTVMDSNIEYNRVVDSGTGEFDFDPITPKRYIFTWNDLDNDGVADYDEDTNRNGILDAGEDINGNLVLDAEILQFQKYFDPASPLDPPFPPVTAIDRAPLNIDFGVHPDGEFDIDGLGLDPCEDTNRNGKLDSGEDLNGNLVLDVGDDRDCDGTFDDASGVVNNIIDWMRGKEIYGMRKREMLYDTDKNPLTAPELITWRLGDVIHSTPISVASPAENYHQLYRDNSYGEFIARWQHRRHMIYYGANDGMLHASNGGFFDEDNQRFCREKDCGATADTPLLGAEMWAYVPYNLLPHLSCLTDPAYSLEDHKYYVDLRPRIFDVQIFKPEPACNDGDPTPTPLADGCIHPNGWGTILVGGMRFGGSKVQPGGLDEDGNPHYDFDGTPGPDYDYDNREFTSAYFVMDITNPEMPPTLLGEFTKTIDKADADLDGDVTESLEVELGYTTVISTMVPMKTRDEALSNLDTDCDGDLVSDPEISMWYLILGSGPTELDGTSNQPGSVSVVPLDRLVSRVAGDDKRNLRIPAAAPAADTRFRPWNDVPDTQGFPIDESKGFGTMTLPELSDANSFVSDTITVDMQIEANYLADVVYFGTVSGTWGDWGGKMYRMVTRKECSLGLQRLAQPSEWYLTPLLDADKPIVAAPTVGTDGTDFWVYFGTGRFFDKLDKTDVSSNATQTFYGIREPLDIYSSDCYTLSWDKVSILDPPFVLDPIVNDPAQITSTSPFTTDPVGITRGELGLLPVGDIRILSTLSQDLANTLICNGDPGILNNNGTPLDPTDDYYVYPDTSCLPETVVPLIAGGLGGTRSFRDLIHTISGTSFRCGVGTLGTDGWYRDIPDARERNLGQAALLGGLLSYTTYTPYEDVCLDEGLGYLYGVYYRTGTAWVQDVFGTVDVNDTPRKENPDRMYLGKGLSTTPNIHVGEGPGGKAFVQTSVGQIVEIPQPNLPEKNVKSGRIKWRDIEQ